LVSASHLTIARDYDLPRQIVWDALVDPDLISGWLAEADVEARVGGSYNLNWIGSATLGPTEGVIVEFTEPETLLISTSNLGSLRFRLDELEGGTRGTSTRLTLTLTIEADERFSVSTNAHWLTNLEQLESLLRGRPVDWAHWDRDWHPIWLELFSNKKVTKPL
jgi:uncharacterized protein YndB with AHSA1/START domain